SAAEPRGGRWSRSSSRHSRTCGGGTTPAATATSPIGPRPRSRRRTTLPSNQPSQRSLDRETGKNETQGDSLQVRAISGITVRQSLLQQRLGLATVTFTTAAGEGKVTAADLGASTAATFIQSVMPDLSGPFLTDRTISGATRKEASSSC